MLRPPQRRPYKGGGDGATKELLSRIPVDGPGSGLPIHVRRCSADMERSGFWADGRRL